MNHSIYSADRTTHLKIVVIGLMAAIAIAAFTTSSHIAANVAPAKTATVIKAGPMAMTRSDLSFTR